MNEETKEELIEVLNNMVLDTKKNADNLYHGYKSKVYFARTGAIFQIKRFIDKNY